MKVPTDMLPPHDLNAERAALGCALHDASLAADLRADWFYDLRHRQAAETLLRMADTGQPIDTATAYQAWNAAGLPAALALVTECGDACPSAANFSYWRDMLAGKLMLRRVIQVAQGAIAEAYETGADPTREPLDCLAEFERVALAVRQQSAGGDGDVDNRAALLELAADYDAAAKAQKPRGLATGFHQLDTLLGGLKPQQLMIIAARPAVGKTSLALGMAERLALGQGCPVGFFSLEMSGKELLHRLACSWARVDGAKLNDGSANGDEVIKVTHATVRIKRAPLHICEAGGLTTAQLTARARRMVQRHGIKILFVDYLGLLRSGEKGRSRYEETTLVSNGLKALAKELNLPVIALAQLNRDTEKEERLPRLSDLRDSGAIEQDADIVALLHRNEQQTGDSPVVNVIIAKQRAGRTGLVELVFHRALTRFENQSVAG